jgi:hypothetical protein
MRTARLESAKIAVVEMGATWLVRRVLDVGFQRTTGHAPPTARDRDVPFRRTIAWAAVTAAAVAVANIIADRVVLRPRRRRLLP